MHICPLCGEEFKTPIRLGNHLKAGDDKHKFLRELITLDKKKTKDFQYIYNTHKERIEQMTDLQQAIADYNDILAAKKEEAERKKQELKDAQRIAKEREKLDKIEAKKLAKLEKKKEEAERYREAIMAKEYKTKHERNFINKLDSDYKPMNLAKYFYDLIDQPEYNPFVALGVIKSLYFKYQLTPEQVKGLLRYTAETGHYQIADAKFLIDEAERFYQYGSQLDEEGTVPHLVKKFFLLRNMKIDKKTFVRNVDRIRTLMKDNNLTYEQGEEIIEYMAAANTNSLFWFNEYINSVVKQEEKEKTNEPKEYEIRKIVDDVMTGKMKYSDISITASYPCFQHLKAIVMRGEFDKSYNYTEWLYKIKMIPDKELIEFIRNHRDRNSRFKMLLEQYQNNSEIFPKIREEFDEYKSWVDSNVKGE